MLELQRRLGQLRSFIWWTAPLYVLFLIAGLYVSNFALTNALGVLAALLVAFAILDGVVLVRIHGIERRPIETMTELRTTKDQIERLARFLLLGGMAFGALFVVALALLFLG